MEKKQWTKIWLLFLWRLEKEKGFDLILETIKNYKGQELPFHLYVFWSGSYEKDLLKLAHTHKEIHYFWWKPLQEIKRYLENIDYCLMPSKFLETFWLSAINVLKRGIPVVWYKKWGLIPFILDEYNVSAQKGETEELQLKNLIERLYQEKNTKDVAFYQSLAHQCKNIAQNYTTDAWIRYFKTLLPKEKHIKKIVLVSDYINKVGGIETYIHDVKKLLEQEGYEVLLYGSHLPQGMKGEMKKYFGLALAFSNIFTAWDFYSFIKKEKPDLIRYHSLIRRIGRIPLLSTRNFRSEKWMMYHDFGYFHPYPHRLWDTQKITSLSLKNYINMWETRNPIKIFAIIWKYYSLKCLQFILKKQINLHLVPSEFMVSIVEKSFKIPKKKIKAFPHFIQE